MLLAWIKYYIMDLIHQDFVKKSKGGTGLDGVSWKPLKTETIAYRPGTFPESSGRERGLLTPAQNRTWKRVYARKLKTLQRRYEGAELKEMAGKAAWTHLKALGARVKLAEASGKKVSILVVSGRLERALRPGQVKDDQYIPTAGHRIEITGITVRVVVNVGYAKKQHENRPILPRDYRPYARKARVLAEQAVANV